LEQIAFPSPLFSLSSIYVQNQEVLFFFPLFAAAFSKGSISPIWSDSTSTNTFERVWGRGGHSVNWGGGAEERLWSEAGLGEGEVGEPMVSK